MQHVVVDAVVATSEDLNGEVATVPALPLPPPPQVYEDIFPIGAVPSGECPLHGQPVGYSAASDRGDASAPATPMVDAALHQTSGACASRGDDWISGNDALRKPANLRRTCDGPDGVTRIIFRQRQ